jgi:hypothetical protein
MVAREARWLLTNPMPLLSEQNDPELQYIHNADYADHPLCPGYILDELSRDSHLTIRTKVASHPGCPPEVIGTRSPVVLSAAL